MAAAEIHHAQMTAGFSETRNIANCAQLVKCLSELIKCLVELSLGQRDLA